MNKLLGILVRAGVVFAACMIVLGIVVHKPPIKSMFYTDPEEKVVHGFETWAPEGDATAPYPVMKKYYRHTKVVDDPRYLKKYGFGNQCTRVVLIYDVRIVPLGGDRLQTEAIMRIRCE